MEEAQNFFDNSLKKLQKKPTITPQRTPTHPQTKSTNTTTLSLEKSSILVSFWQFYFVLINFTYFQLKNKTRNKTFFQFKNLNENKIDFVVYIICIKCVFNLTKICVKFLYKL